MARTVPTGLKQAGDSSALGYISITCPAAGGAVAVASVKISNNTGVHQGQMVGYKAKSLPCTNAVNFTVGIKDRDSDTIYTGAAHASHAVNTNVYVVMSLAVPIMEQETIIITPDAEPGATGLIVRVTLYYNPDADIIAWGYR